MSNSNSGISDIYIVGGILGFVGVLIGAMWLKGFLQLDIKTTWNVLKILVPVTAAWLYLWRYTSFSFKNTWPLALASIWFCFWPALNYWSWGNLVYSDEIYQAFQDPKWYATSLWQWGILAGIVVVGYIINSWISD